MQSRVQRQLLATRRSGKVLVLFAVLLPAMLTFIGLIIDGGLLQGTYRRAQHTADATATAAARALQRGKTDDEAAATGQTTATDLNGVPVGGVTIRRPPERGPNAGNPDAVEVEIVDHAETNSYGFIGGESAVEVHSRAVAGWRPSTARAAIVVLDPDPPHLSVPPLPGVLPALIGGFEI